ncbi:MAG: hypothetical protein U0325_20465 [Polyangiales bacterium]
MGTTAVSNLIREGKTYQLYGQMQSSRTLGHGTGERPGSSTSVLTGVVDPRDKRT